jgi:putative membrane protein
MRSLGIASLACAAALTLACNADNRNERATSEDDFSVGTSGAGVDRGDREFVAEMLAGGAAEVQLGKLAAERGASNDVKQFGQQMVADHTRAGEELKQIASQFNVNANDPSFADDENDEHAELIAKLSALRGSEFDRAYIDAMVDGHQEVVDKLQSRVDERDRTGVATGQTPKDVNVKPEPSDTSTGSSLNSWAASTLPVVKGHLERAKAIDDRLK